MDIQEKLKQALYSLNLKEPEILVEKVNGGLFAQITSGSFDAMDEGDRQELVWKVLLEQLDADEQTRIEFVFTYPKNEVSV